MRAIGGAGGLGLEATGGQLDAASPAMVCAPLVVSPMTATGARLFMPMADPARTAATESKLMGYTLGGTRGKAGLFHGDVQVNGVLSKAGGSFKIDHPLDPENKYLAHSFVESRT